MTREKIADAVVEIGTDTTGLNRGIAGVKGQLGGLTGTIGRVAGALGIAFGVTRIVAFARASVKASADYEQSLGRFRTMMGEQSAASEKWLQSENNRYGASRQMAMEHISNLATMFRAVGVTEEEAAATAREAFAVTGDLASHLNRTLETTMPQVLSYLRGMARSGYEIGVFADTEQVATRAMEMFNVATKEAVTSQQLFLARLDILKQSARDAGAIGDWTNSLDTMEHITRRASASWQDLKSNIGKAMSDFLDLSGLMTSVNDGIETLVGSTNTWGEGLNYIKVLHAELAYTINATVQKMIAGYGMLREASLVLVTGGMFGGNFSAVLDEYDAMMKAHWEVFEENLEKAHQKEKKSAVEVADAVVDEEEKKQDAIKDTLGLLSGYAAWWEEAQKWAQKALAWETGAGPVPPAVVEAVAASAPTVAKPRSKAVSAATPEPLIPRRYTEEEKDAAERRWEATAAVVNMPPRTDPALRTTNELLLKIATEIGRKSPDAPVLSFGF